MISTVKSDMDNKKKIRTNNEYGNKLYKSLETKWPYNGTAFGYGVLELSSNRY